MDPGTVSLTITREDGSVIAAAQPTSGTGVAVRTFNLTAATHTNALDFLTLSWLSASKGTLTTSVEVCGAFLTSLAELRATNPLNDVVTYPTADLIAYRTLAEAALEWACGVSFAPRYFRLLVDGTGTCDVLLPPRPLSVASVTVDKSSTSAGTVLTADQLTDLRLYPDGRVYNPLGWSAGRKNVEVRGSQGFAQVPPYVGRAVKKLVKRFMMDSPVSDRATSMTNDSGGYTYLLTAGMKDQVFDIPDALVCVQAYGVSSGIA